MNNKLIFFVDDDKSAEPDGVHQMQGLMSIIYSRGMCDNLYLNPSLIVLDYYLGEGDPPLCRAWIPSKINEQKNSLSFSAVKR
jgi:hypothetical protein